MSDPNINRPEWDVPSSEALSSRRAMRLGPRAGTGELGATLYELDPGGAVSPYHAHHGNEELLLVLSGHPTLRTPAGLRRLEGGDVVAFPRGPAGAHRISNDSDEMARVLVFSTMHWPEIAEYPDTGATLAVTGPGQGKAFPANADQPRAEAVRRAMDAARRHEVAFVPEDFAVPEGLTGPGFRLEPLGPRHNESDHAAWTSSIEHIRATPGFPDGQWPPMGGLSLEENLRDLQRHADDFERRVGFTYTVLGDEGGVIGCVYIYPSKSDTRVARVQSWVSAESAELDLPLSDAVARWLAIEWPFSEVRYR